MRRITYVDLREARETEELDRNRDREREQRKMAGRNWKKEVRPFAAMASVESATVIKIP